MAVLGEVIAMVDEIVGGSHIQERISVVRK